MPRKSRRSSRDRGRQTVRKRRELTPDPDQVLDDIHPDEHSVDAISIAASESDNDPDLQPIRVAETPQKRENGRLPSKQRKRRLSE